MLYDVFCDESAHLPADRQTAMVLGAVWCPHSETERLNAAISEIKAKHGLGRFSEVKWTRVSLAKLDLYLELVDMLVDTPEIRFRGVIIPKAGLDHDRFQQTADSFYYKMYYTMLNLRVVRPSETYRIYLDIKDTRSKEKIAHLRKVLCFAHHDFSLSIIERMQAVRSEHIPLLQLADVIIGAISAANRGSITSPAKRLLLAHIQRRTGLTLTYSTAMLAPKFNVFRWSGKAP